jgi:DNA replication protein DnaC
MCPHFIAFNARLGNANIPKDYESTTLSNSPVRADVTVTATVDGQRVKSTQVLTDYLEKYAASFRRTDGKRVKSIYLWSPAKGNGKTTTAAALANEWLVAHYTGQLAQGTTPSQTPMFFLDVNEWQTLFNGFNRSHVPTDRAERISAKYYAWMDRAQRAPFAVFDDIGVRNATEAFRGDLHTLINHRTVNGMPTVYTSNVDIAGLGDVFDERLADRVRDMCFEVEFSGESRRGVRK